MDKHSSCLSLSSEFSDFGYNMNGGSVAVCNHEAGVYGVEEYTQIRSVHIEFSKRGYWV